VYNRQPYPRFYDVKSNYMKIPVTTWPILDTLCKKKNKHLDVCVDRALPGAHWDLSFAARL
jgi:hypothetical protein